MKKKGQKKKIAARKLSNFFTSKLLWLIAVIPIIILSQYFLLLPHQQYGFYDVDWGFLSFFKQPASNPFLPLGFIERYAWLGPYGHESYYVGTLVSLFGLDFHAIQLATQVFKVIGIFVIFFAIVFVFDSPLLAFTTAVIASFSFASIGSLSNVVTGTEYLGTIFFAAFYWTYASLILSKRTDWKKVILSFILLYTCLVVATTRLFPLIFVTFFTELYILYAYPKLRKVTGTRMLVLLGPILLISIVFPSHVSSWLIANAPDHIHKIQNGDFSLALQPLMSLGSILLPHDTWVFFGIIPYSPSIDTGWHHLFKDYILFFQILKFITLKTFIIFGISTYVFGFLLFKHPKKFIIRTMVGVLILGTTTSFIMGIGHKNSMDPSFLAPALIGIYVLSFAYASFLEWKRRNNLLYLGLFVSPCFALIMIFFTWIATNNIPFLAPHRYVTIPSLWMSFFLASLVVVSFKNLQKKKLPKALSYVPFLLFIPLFLLDTTVINNYFKHELSIGYGANDQQNMRKQLNSYLGKLPTDKPSLFYFDTQSEPNNSEWYANTVTSGFPTWMLWNPRINFNAKLTPDLFWNSESQLHEYIGTQSGVTGFIKNKVFYTPSHFYAFQLKNKKVKDITKEVLQKLGIR